MAAAALCLAACSTHHPGIQAAPDGGDGGSTSLVVGLTADSTNGVLGSIHATTAIDGVAATDDVVAVLGNASAFPKAITLTAPQGKESAHIIVVVDGYLDPAWDPTKTNEQPILTRTVETDFVPNQSELLRVHLEQQCISGVAGSGFNGPMCAGAHLSCISGVCADDTVPSAQLEPFASDWATNAPDICKPVNAGPPLVIVGTGQTDYLPLTDGQTLKAECGPQGGHHVWIATRMHNLKQVGSTTTITGSQPGGPSAPPTSFVFVFNQDEGGYCKLAGLRYQLDSGGTDYHLFLGKPLDVQVVVQDSSGHTGTGVAHINIDATLLSIDPMHPCM